MVADPDWGESSSHPTRELDGWETFPEPGSVSQPAGSLVCWSAGGLPGPGGVSRPANSLVCWLAGRLPGPAPAHALPVYLPLGVEILVKSVALPATRSRGLRSCSTAHSRTCERQRSCCDSSRFPSARVRSRRSRLSY